MLSASIATPDNATTIVSPAPASIAMPTGEIKALTSLRGIAAMMVVLQHFSAAAETHSASPIPSLVPHGYIAVDLFFVLSGFIMAYTYLTDFKARGIRAFPNFLLKRVARIVPLNTAAVILVLLGGVISQVILSRNIVHPSTTPLTDGLCNILMLQGLGIGLNLNAPSWSISCEFAAYFLFPGLLAVIFTRRSAILFTAVAVSVTSLVIVGLSHPHLGLDTYTIGGGLTRCFAEFTIGLATYRAVSVAWVRRAVAADSVAGACIIAGLILLLLRYDLLIAATFPLLIASLACNRGRTARLLSARIPYFLGAISFSIYLLHAPLRPVGLELLRTLHPAPLAAPLAMLAALAGSLLVLPIAWVGFVLVEKPGRTLIRVLISHIGRRPAEPTLRSV